MSGDFKYPDDVAMAYELPGVYDGVSVWQLKNGRMVNRFAGEGSRREALIDEWIAENSGRSAG